MEDIKIDKNILAETSLENVLYDIKNSSVSKILFHVLLFQNYLYFTI